ncbi:MAG: DUF1902 domain-containing protein [Oscillospiraceae bacterium]|nr:DUF1902 domain-containing protein [Oscillospiraceae bacterium]
MGRNSLKCIVRLTWDDGVWYSKAVTDTAENIGLTLESGSFDALIERVKIALPEMLELNFGYKGDIKLVFEAERDENIKRIAS